MEIADMVSDNPKEALEGLYTINPDSLSKADRHYFDFLTIKAKDKAYMPHTSDSLICDIINYASSHKDEGYYAEALYYGGRVYSDLGDLPTALDYFQKSIEVLSENKEYTSSIFGSAVSQTGGLLSQLRMYNHAIPYIREAARIDSLKRDSINYIYDLRLLGSLYSNIDKYDSAEWYYEKGLKIASTVSLEETVVQKMLLASLLNRKENSDSALYLIRDVMNHVDTLYRSVALVCASDIYLKRGILDTVFMYANMLVHGTDSLNRIAGYQFLLDPELTSYSPTDSLINYVQEYHNLIDEKMDRNQSEAVIWQNSYYNYNVKEKEKMEAERHSSELVNWLLMTCVVITGLFCVVSYLKYRNQLYRLRLQAAIADIELLNQKIDSQNNHLRQTLSTDTSNDQSCATRKEVGEEVLEIGLLTKHTEERKATSDSTDDLSSLRIKLREKLYNLQKNESPNTNPPEIIASSEAYAKLEQLIAEGKYLPEDSSLWIELEKVVLKCSKDFKQNLRLLTGYNLSTTDFHMALLV
ncbi:MAG: hypothetical protein K2J63_01815, partial [Muribaculaceae bacterium]|nr:hypothetical protein [Muribaculaceae bacterium]